MALALAPIAGSPYIGTPVPGFVHITSGGLQQLRKSNLTALLAPTVTDDSDAGYSVGSQWINTVTGYAYTCTDATPGAAAWSNISATTVPAGSATELQYRASASTFGAVTGSSTANGGIALAPSSGIGLTLTGTTEQMRVRYDASNYYSTTVSSAGAVTFDAVGASVGFTFSDPVSCPGAGGLGERFGASAVAAGNAGTAIGNSASAAGASSIAIGYAASSPGQYDTAIGVGAVTSGGSIAIGQAGYAVGGSVTLGVGATCNTYTSSIAIGRSATNTANNQMLVGSTAFPINALKMITDGTGGYCNFGVSSGNLTVTVTGSKITLTGNAIWTAANIEIGDRCSCTNQGVAIGIATTASGGDAIAIGRETTASGGSSLALGMYSGATSSFGVSLGGASNTGAYAFCVGSGTHTNSANAIAIGKTSVVRDAANGIAIGTGATNEYFNYSIALGAGATITASNQCVFGSTTAPINALKMITDGTTGSCNFGVTSGNLTITPSGGKLTVVSSDTGGGAIDNGLTVRDSMTPSRSGGITFGANAVLQIGSFSNYGLELVRSNTPFLTVATDNSVDIKYPLRTFVQNGGRVTFSSSLVANSSIVIAAEGGQSPLSLYSTGGGGIDITNSNKVGIGTTAPDKQLEINSATGDCLRLTYNDANGSAANYTDLAVTSGGNLTITPSGGQVNIAWPVITGGAINMPDGNWAISTNSTSSALGGWGTRIAGRSDSDSGRGYAFWDNSRNACVMSMSLLTGATGINTTTPDKQLEINSATGDCLRLTYNDSNGSAANYADFAVSSGGNLTLTPSGNSTSLVGGLIINDAGGDFDVRFEGDTDANLFFLDASTDSIGIGTNAPSARLHIKAGGTAAGSAPLKLTTQASGLSTVEQGAFELIGNSLQFTQLAKRRGVAMCQSTRTSDFTLGNDATESAAVITAEHGANYLEVGKCEEIVLRGTIQQTNAGGGQLQVRVKYAGSTLQTITTSAGTIAAGTPFEIRVSATCRSTGGTGTMQFNSVLWIDGVTNIPDSVALPTIDTTTAQNTTITFQWTSANASNTITVNQGRVLCIEPNK